MLVAVIGIGSNSVRMLLAEVGGGEMRRIRRDREGTRLFAGLSAQRCLSSGAMESTAAAVSRMAADARAAGAAAQPRGHHRPRHVHIAGLHAHAGH